MRRLPDSVVLRIDNQSLFVTNCLQRLESIHAEYDNIKAAASIIKLQFIPLLQRPYNLQIFSQIHNAKENFQILNQIWKPNTVFINSKSASIHKSPFTNLFLMIYSNGTVWANYRYSKFFNNHLSLRNDDYFL